MLFNILGVLLVILINVSMFLTLLPYAWWMGIVWFVTFALIMTWLDLVPEER